MDFSVFDQYRNNSLFGLAASVISGMLLAAAAFTLKLGLGEILIPTLILPLIFAIIGFVVMQIAFRVWHLNGAMPVISGTVVVISNTLGYIILKEAITLLQWASIGVIVVGVALFIRTAKIESK